MPLLQPGSRSPRIQARLAQATAEVAVQGVALAVDAAADATAAAADATAAAATANAAAAAAAAQTDALKKANAIGDSFTIPSVVLTATAAGDIIVASHTRRYPDADFPDVAITGATVVGAANDTLYAVYYDDPTLSGGTPTFLITTTIEDGQAGVAVGRHSLGTIKVPVTGGASNTGGGYNPPGGGAIP